MELKWQTGSKSSLPAPVNFKKLQPLKLKLRKLLVVSQLLPSVSRSMYIILSRVCVPVTSCPERCAGRVRRCSCRVLPVVVVAPCRGGFPLASRSVRRFRKEACASQTAHRAADRNIQGAWNELHRTMTPANFVQGCTAVCDSPGIKVCEC